MTTSYDLIATIYDADMGASMTLPDVRYYVQIARAVGGPVVELGCGTGRVLRGLQAAGIDVSGVDRSSAMLAQARERLGSPVPLICMDIRQLDIEPRFSLALLSYSLPTYLTDDWEWAALAGGLRSALVPGGLVLLDAFIPQPVTANRGWTRDYARSVNGNWLVRHKRIDPLGPDRNRIERRYRLRGVFDGRTLQTCEEIRTYTPNQLVSIADRYIGPVQRIDFDYGNSTTQTGARFCSVLARMR